jgi:hypothetical protein
LAVNPKIIKAKTENKSTLDVNFILEPLYNFNLCLCVSQNNC